MIEGAAPRKRQHKWGNTPADLRLRCLRCGVLHAARGSRPSCPNSTLDEPKAKRGRSRKSALASNIQEPK